MRPTGFAPQVGLAQAWISFVHGPTKQGSTMDDEQPRDWGNVRFSPRARLAPGTADDNAGARFGIAMTVFLLVALAYPWYSYWVQAKLLERDLGAATAQLEGEVQAAQADLSRELQGQQGRQNAMTERRRLGGVRIVGATVTRGVPVVIVDLGEASLVESTPTVCREASSWLGRLTTGMTLRVQRHRGNAPAMEAGVIHC